MAFDILSDTESWNRVRRTEKIRPHYPELLHRYSEIKCLRGATHFEILPKVNYSDGYESAASQTFCCSHLDIYDEDGALTAKAFAAN